MRGVEVAFLANPKKCASSDEVRDWVLKVLAQEKVELRIDVRAKPYPERDTGFANVPECGSIPSVDWRTDTVKVVHFVDVDPSSAET